MRESLDRVAGYLRSEMQTWSQVFGLILAFFILSTAITNVLHDIFNFTLLPVFENTLEHIREFFHILFNFLVYFPISATVSWVAELIFNINIPVVRPPTWYTDLVLVSMVLSRAERAAMKMSEPIKDDIEIPRSGLERFFWRIVMIFYVPTKAILVPVKRFSPYSAYSSLRIFLDGITWLGFWFLFHDLAVVRQYWGQEFEAVKSHRAFVLFMMLSLLAATAASIAFFILNGYLHHYF